MQRSSAKLFSSVASSSTAVKPFSEIPGPFRFPVFGNLPLYKLGYYKLDEYHLVLERLYKKYGPIVRQQIGSYTVVHVFEPEDAKTVFGVGGKTPEVPPLQPAARQYRQKRNLTPGLGNMNGEEWYRLRSAVQQMMMRPKEVQHYLPLIDTAAKTFVNKIKALLKQDKEIQNLQMLVSKWILESSGLVCFETSLGCLDGQEKLAEKMIEANNQIFKLSAELKFSMGLHNYIPTPKWKRFEAAEDFFVGQAFKYLERTMGKIKELVETGQLKDGQFNFVSYLMSRKELSHEDVRIITMSLFADGLTTTAPTMMYNLYNLAKYPDIQDKVYKEICQNMSSSDEAMSVDVLNRLSYLKATVKETFRVLTISTEVSRIIPVDLVLSNYKVPAGTHVDLNQFVQFKSPTQFSDPEKFSPERWLRDGSASAASASAGSASSGSSVQGQPTPHPFVLTPFGHGTRMCAGRRFAEQDLWTALVRILQSFRLELADPNAQMEQKYSTLLFPKHPLRIRFIPRD